MRDPVSAVIRLYAAVLRARLTVRERTARARAIHRLEQERKHR